jgi:hypothetical protein
VLKYYDPISGNVQDEAFGERGHPLKGPCQEKKALLRKKKWFLENPTH